MSKQNKPPEPEAPSAPELIPEPVQSPSIEEGPGYKPAATDIESVEHLKLVENFIGSIYGEAKQIDKSNISNSEYTKGLKFNAEQEIINARKDLHSRSTGSPTMRSPSPQQPIAQLAPNVQPPPDVRAIQPPANMQAPVNTSDSLILKHEIDQMKEQLKDIKKLYDEFFKLKQVKGHWQIKSGSKVQKATSISKTWNILNKLLKNKSESIIIEYNDSDE